MEGRPLTLADFESTHFHGAPGPRIIFKGKALAIENKFGPKPQYNQMEGQEVEFPSHQWVTVKLHFQYDEKEGTNQMWQDVQLIVNAIAPNVLLSFCINESIEIGISAKTNESVVYMDEMRLSDRAF